MFCVLLGSAFSIGWSQGPASVVITPGIIEIHNITYDAGSDPSALTGQGDLVITLAGSPSTGHVHIDKLQADSTGTHITQLAMTLASELDIAQPFGAGTALQLNPGEIDFKNNGLSFVKTGVLSLPFRQLSGDPLPCDVSNISATNGASGKTVTLGGVVLGGAGSTDGLQLLGVKVKGSLNFVAQIDATPAPTWDLESKDKTIEADFSIPGLATSDTPYPIVATVTGLMITQDGLVNFLSGQISTSSIKPSQAKGFELQITQGALSMTNSNPQFNSVTGNLLLPPGLTTPGQPTTRATITNLTVDFSKGLVIEAVKTPNGTTPQLDCMLDGVELKTTTFGLDLSSETAITNAPAPMSKPSWMGLWIKQGSLSVPLDSAGSKTNGLSCTDFRIDSQGLTGAIKTIGAPQQVLINGFPITLSSGSVQIDSNQLTKGSFSGSLAFPSTNIPDVSFTGGTLGVGISFDKKGLSTLQISDTGAISIPDVGLKLSNIKGSFDKGNISLSGNLGLDTSRIQLLPPDFPVFGVQVSDLKISSAGKLLLPKEAFITFPTPATVDLGIVDLEIRRLGFTSNGQKLTSAIFSAGAHLENVDDILPASAELDFEGLKVVSQDSPDYITNSPTSSTAPGLPQFQLGGFKLDVNLQGIGEISGALKKQKIAGFGDTLSGDVLLKLSSLGDVASGIGLNFAIAPSPPPTSTGVKMAPAWFVGGNVTVPPILVQIPPAPPAEPPIPLFNIMGFDGGFGLNVKPAEGQHGRISDISQLAPSPGDFLAQAGLLLADPVPGAPGHVWWADTALTFTLQPLTIDLGGKAVFLDTGNPDFISDADWHNKDRIASAFLDFDFSTPAVTMGADFDLTFPTRKASILNASGQGEMKIGHNVVRIPTTGSDGKPTFTTADGVALHIGSKDYGQKPVQLEIGQILDGIADVNVQGSLVYCMALQPAPTPNAAPTFKTFGTFDVDANAKFNVPGATVDAEFDASLDVTGSSGSGFSAQGDVDISGVADFGFFKAQAEGHGLAQFNTQSYPNEFFIDGSVSGSVAGFTASAGIQKVLFQVPTA